MRTLLCGTTHGLLREQQHCYMSIYKCMTYPITPAALLLGGLEIVQAAPVPCIQHLMRVCQHSSHAAMACRGSSRTEGCNEWSGRLPAWNPQGVVQDCDSQL